MVDFTNVVPIIVLNWNGLADTLECMDSLEMLEGEAYHIFLVDNGSGPRDRETLKSRYLNKPRVTLILNDVNKGFTRGNNDVLKEILSAERDPKYIALLNNDTVVSPIWLKSLISSAESNNGDVVSSRMINYYNRSETDNLGHFMLNTGEILPIGHGSPRESHLSTFENVGACGGAALYRTSMIRKIGFFDDYFSTGYEDAEFGLRAKLLGYKCLYEPDAVVYHKVSRSVKKIRDDEYIQQIQINIFYTYLKLMSWPFIAFNSIFILVKYMIWLVLGLLTFQFKLIRLHSNTLSRFIRDELGQALKARNSFYHEYSSHLKSPVTLLWPAQFFFLTDLRRIRRKLKR